ncbi:uncharacterized protein LOC125651687 [Ostrea edulis]|uniref:uncharacterized protein LOC125651687 n=1 Tax=Ostrea edulis TaxID=37623 RepID=UPI00209609E3|nr:uncharacterized protein LOC125651687 [Ostrea edulis]
MRGLTIQVLAAILLSVSLSYSQENGERWEFPKYMVVDKQINVREIIRFGGRQSEEQNEKEFEVPGEAGSRRFSASSLLTMLSNAAKMRKVKNMLPLSGIQWIKDDDIGKAINCGPPGSHINVTWKPRIIDPQKSVEIFFDIVDPIDFVKGYADITVYNGGSPIFSLDQDITCQIVAKELPLIKCPIKKGQSQKGSFQYKNLSQLKEGSFSIVLKIFSYASKPPPLFSCLNVTVDIKSSANRAVHPTPQVIV